MSTDFWWTASSMFALPMSSSPAFHLYCHERLGHWEYSWSKLQSSLQQSDLLLTFTPNCKNVGELTLQSQKEVTLIVISTFQLFNRRVTRYEFILSLICKFSSACACIV
eukprot:2557940-Amphidinium_carterae.1